jgi:hypothetical protein
MAGGTTATLNGLLKNDIEPGIISQLNDETPLLESFGEGKPIKGKGLVKGIRVNRNRGGYYTAEGGTPPTAGTPEIQEILIPNRFYHHAWSITKQLMDASSSNEASFGDAMTIGMEDVQEGVKIKRNQAYWGDGRGILALCNGAQTTTTVTVDAPGGIAGSDDGSRFVNVGDYVAGINPAGALRQTTAYLVASVPTSATFTTSSAVTWSDNDYVVKCGQISGTLTIGNTEYGHAVMGLSGLVDNGTLVNIYFGKSRTTFPVLNATVITSVGAIGADVIQRAIDVTAKMSGGRTKELWCEPGVKRAYLKSMESDRRYTAGDLLNPNAGTVASNSARRYADTGLKFGTIPLFQDHYCPYGHLFGLDTQYIKRHPGPMGWVDEDGNVLSRSTTAVDTFEAMFRCFENLSSERPNTSWKLSGITHDFVSAHVI